MSELPDPIRRLDVYFAAATVAHEAIADMHSELVELNVDDPRSRELLAAAASIVLEQMPRLARPIRLLSDQWSEQDVLDPHRAEQTVKRLAAALEEIEPTLIAVRDRQRALAAELAERLRATRGAQ